MAGSILIAGPAGSSKSQRAKQRLSETSGPIVAVDFQAIVASLLLLERGPDGRYPIRPTWVLGLAEYTRQAIITGATGREIPIVATNSDGSPERRRALLDRLGPDATEEVVDPGIEVVRARLSSPISGDLDPECENAIQRWYSRKR